MATIRCIQTITWAASMRVRQNRSSGHPSGPSSAISNWLGHSGITQGGLVRVTVFAEPAQLVAQASSISTLNTALILLKLALNHFNY